MTNPFRTAYLAYLAPFAEWLDLPLDHVRVWALGFVVSEHFEEPHGSITREMIHNLSGDVAETLELEAERIEDEWA